MNIKDIKIYKRLQMITNENKQFLTESNGPVVISLPCRVVVTDSINCLTVKI